MFRRIIRLFKADLFYVDNSDRWITNRIAASAGKVFVQLLSDCSFLYAVTYAVDEGYLHPSSIGILADDPSECVHLELKLLPFRNS